MDEWNRLTPVRRRLSLTQAARGKPISTGLAPVSGTKARSLEAFSQYSVFHLWFVHSDAQMPSLARLSKRFHAAGTNGRLDLSLTWRVSEDPLNPILLNGRVLKPGPCENVRYYFIFLDKILEFFDFS